MTQHLPWTLTVDRPAWLMLGLLIPLLWWWSRQRLRGVANGPRWWMILFRTVVLSLLILALANVQLVRSSHRLTVLFLLDQSASIPAVARDAMVPFVTRQVAEHRDSTRSDRAGVIVFANEARMEVPPIDDDLPLIDRFEGVDQLPTDATDLSAALRLAMATFPEDTARRVVIITDGNETIGSAAETAARLATAGVGIDVVPVQLPPADDVAVERIVLPAEIRHGQPFEARLVLQRNVPADAAVGPTTGRLKLIRRRSGMDQTIAEEAVEVPPGRTVWTFRDALDRPDFYEYQAIFLPDDPHRDAIVQNNRASGFTQLRGKGRILMVEDAENRDVNGLGSFAALANVLERLDFEVSVRFTDDLFYSLAELQSFDVVLLADAGRSSLAQDETQRLRPANFSDEQIDMLVQNTRQFGCGLIMLGGPNSFGAGGWANTELEKILPVDCQIRSDKSLTVGALAMVMHASEMPEGNRWQKLIAREALRVLGPQDYCGVVEWNQQRGSEDWLWGGESGGLLKIGNNLPRMLDLLGNMTPGDMPDFEPSLQLAADSFRTLPAVTLKHMIVISDGDPTPPRPGGAVASLQQQKVQVSTVAVGTHGPAGSAPLQNLAQATGGQYYAVRSPSELPRIFQREARRVAKPLIVERRLRPQRQFSHEILQAITALPPIDGFVMTTVKENPLVEVPIITPYPADGRHASLLAVWTVGLGRVAAWTTDAGQRWARDWLDWPDYDRFFGQLVRWCLRPMSDSDQITATAQVENDHIHVIVDILEEENPGQLANMTASLIDPDMQVVELPLRRVAPQRYIGDSTAVKPGSYFVNVRTLADKGPLRIGVSVPYSSEFRQRESNLSLLQHLAAVQPVRGQPGVLDEPIPRSDPGARLTLNPFRRDLAPAFHFQRAWPWCLLAASIIFVGDVLCRKVALQTSIRPWWARMWKRPTPTEETPEHLERLRQRKSDAAAPWMRTHPGWSASDQPVGLDQPPDRKELPASETPTASERTLDDQDAYIDRLLRAKKGVRHRSDDATSD